MDKQKLPNETIFDKFKKLKMKLLGINGNSLYKFIFNRGFDKVIETEGGDVTDMIISDRLGM